MATGEHDEEHPSDPVEMLPEDSILSFKEYIDMQRAIGEPTRYRLLYYLTTCGDASPQELKEALDLTRNTLHYHLNKLIDVGLVQKRARNEPDSASLYTYYRASSFGEMILEKGVTEMIQMEDDFREMYGATEDSG
jgi:ArsR family transcriptional regulator